MKQFVKYALALSLCLAVLCCTACGSSSKKDSAAAPATATSAVEEQSKDEAKTDAAEVTSKTVKKSSSKGTATSTTKAAAKAKTTAKAKASATTKATTRAKNATTKKASTTKVSTTKKASTTKASSQTKTVSVAGPDGTLSVKIPEGWSYRKCSVGSGMLAVGDYGFLIYPDDSTGGYLEISYARYVGACGEGMTEKTQTIAGKTATVGYASGSKNWSYIIYGGPNGHVIAIADNADTWMTSKSTDVNTIINSVKLDTSTKTGAYPDEA